MYKYTLAVAIAIALLFPAPEFSQAQQKVKTLEIGRQAPDFNLPGVDGRNYRLADFAEAKILVVIFTCNHCPTAQAYEDRIIKLASDYKNKGVVVVAISPNDPQAVRLDELGYSDMSDTFEEMKIRSEDKNYNFPYLYDGKTQKVTAAYGAVATPHLFIFDSQRKLRYTGRFDDSEKQPKQVKSNDAINAIKAILAGRKVPVEKTIAFGCSVKWASKRGSAKAALASWAREEVSLTKINAEAVNELIKNNSAKLRLINVWATWSRPSVKQLEQFVIMNRMYRRRDFELITISADSPAKEQQVLAALKKQQASCKNYLFAQGDIYQLMRAIDKDMLGGVPCTLVIEPGGKVIYRRLGTIEPLELKKTIVEYVGRYYK
ncbi:MAG: redoxin domain-containing protein [Planctomycetota bacterium]|jgi:peroxiredoxin